MEALHSDLRLEHFNKSHTQKHFASMNKIVARAKY